MRLFPHHHKKDSAAHIRHRRGGQSSHLIFISSNRSHNVVGANDVFPQKSLQLCPQTPPFRLSLFFNREFCFNREFSIIFLILQDQDSLLGTQNLKVLKLMHIKSKIQQHASLTYPTDTAQFTTPHNLRPASSYWRGIRVAPREPRHPSPSTRGTGEDGGQLQMNKLLL